MVVVLRSIVRRGVPTDGYALGAILVTFANTLVRLASLVSWSYVGVRICIS